MNAAQIQARIYAGYGKAALSLGTLYNQHRPSGAANPLATIRGTLHASFNAEDFGYKKPNKYGQPTWYGVFDGNVTQPGDYLVGAAGTFFIAAQQSHLPILLVECNRVVRVLRAPEVESVGAVSYSGACAADAVEVLTGWPASILLKGRAEPTGTGLPAATKNIGWQILLPPSIPITINASDILVDDLGRRYAVQGAEQTDLGWRIQSVEEHA